jgi:hypothetical protein
MKRPHRIVHALLRLYPAAWRQEYGAELADVLSQRPLTAGTVADVVQSAVVQRARYTEPSVRIGAGVMVFLFAGIVWNIAAPSLASHAFGAVLEDSSKTLPTVIVTPFASGLYVLMLIACGGWAQLRRRGPLSQSGMAAVRLGAVAGIPVMFLGVLMFLGLIHLHVVGPDDALTRWSGRGWTYTYYTAQSRVPSPLAVFAAPLFRLPESWLWGLVGGRLGRAVARRRETGLARS